MKTDVLILGGGLAGLSTAHHLGRLGVRSRRVLEAQPTVGGTAGSEARDGFLFDHTGHLLHLHDPYGQAFILGLLKKNVAVHERRAAIYSKQTLTPYPFQAHTKGLPQRVVVDCVAGFLETVHRPRVVPKGADFLAWCLGTFGEGITRHFLKPYNEKLWQTSLAKMTTQWQGRFVPKPTACEVLYGALSDTNKLFGYNATFRYPRRGGCQALPDALARTLEPGVVCTNARVKAVDLREKVALVAGLGEVYFDRLVNTLPLPAFLDIVADLPDAVLRARRALRWNTVWNLNLGVARPDVTDKHWIYFPEKRFPFYRVGCASNFSSAVAPAGHSSLYVEVSRPGGAKVARAGLEREVLKGLRECGLLRRSDELSARAWMPIEFGYVVYDFARAPALAEVFRHLSRRGIESVGRYGAWKYSFMEETILDGKACAERLAGARAGSAPAPESDAELRVLR